MTEITLVRHGQASFGSDDYDRLSPLGHQQSRWLGEYYAHRQQHFDRILIGSQRRHRETAEGIAAALGNCPDLEIHPGLDEYDFHALFAAFSRRYPEQLETGFSDHRHFYAILRRALTAWSQQQLEGTEFESSELEGTEPGSTDLKCAALETWQDFNNRVRSAVEFITMGDNKSKALVVSSGGAISMVLKHALQLAPDTMISLNLQIINTAFSKLLVSTSRTQLLSFNNIPHLDAVDRQHSITYS